MSKWDLLWELNVIICIIVFLANFESILAEMQSNTITLKSVLIIIWFLSSGLISIAKADAGKDHRMY